MSKDILFPRSIELLNKAVDNEIVTSLQYIYFHTHCEDAGYKALAKFFKVTAIREMVHIEMLSERILFLGGDVNMNTSFKTKAVADVAEMLKLSAQLEKQTIDNYNSWSKECSDLLDATTHHLFLKLVGEEEEHFDAFRTEQDNMHAYNNDYLMFDSYATLKSRGKDE